VTASISSLGVLALLFTLLPYPRFDLISRGIIILLDKLVSLIIVVSVFARPLLDALKVDVLAKSLSAIIVVSTLAPRTGEYIRTREYHTQRFRERFDDSIGDQMVEFRRDIRLMYVRNSEHDGDIPSKPELVADIKASRREIRRRHDIGELVVAIAIAFLALIVSGVSVLGGVGLLLGFYSLLLPLSMFMRNTVLDTLAYAGEPIGEGYEPVLTRNRRALIFMRKWNQFLVHREGSVQIS
jgi:hypothetical protein